MVNYKNRYSDETPLPEVYITFSGGSFVAGAESIIGSGNPLGASTPLMQNYTQLHDNTRVARPIYPLP